MGVVATENELRHERIYGEMLDIRNHNREAWDRQVEKGNQWTIPVSPQRIVDARSVNFSRTATLPRDDTSYERRELIVAFVANALPYSEAESLSPKDLAQRRREGTPLEFGHTLDDLIGGQLECGFVITGFYEDRCPQEEHDVLGHYMSTFMATRAFKS